MKVIKLKIDLLKLDKSKIVSRTYTNKAGEEVTVKELSLDLIPLRNEQLVSQGDTWKLMKTHFIAEPQTKEQRDAKEKSKIVGDGMEFQNKENPADGKSEEYPPEDNCRDCTPEKQCASCSIPF